MKYRIDSKIGSEEIILTTVCEDKLLNMERKIQEEIIDLKDKAIIDGLKKLGWVNMKWISVKDRLPEENGAYLAYIDTNIVKVFYVKDDYFSYGYYSNRVFPTHWMPLPEPPEN